MVFIERSKLVNNLKIPMFLGKGHSTEGVIIDVNNECSTRGEGIDTNNKHFKVIRRGITNIDCFYEHIYDIKPGYSGTTSKDFIDIVDSGKMPREITHYQEDYDKFKEIIDNAGL